MSATHTLPCGCSFPVVGPPPAPGAAPRIRVDLDALDESCRLTWDTLARGLTKGVFQLESRLGRAWTKKLKPSSVFHMGALGALLRPGPLQAKDDKGVSLTEHYALRKNGEEPVEPFHPAVDEILGDTYCVCVFQEQMMFLSRNIAGFDEMGMDKLRKSIGKKDQKSLAEVREKFLAGARRVGALSDEQAATVWGWIQTAGRYAFNRSHADCYGVRGFKTAYLKAHFPVEFFAAWLKNARLNSDPRQEVYELVLDARMFGVEVRGPDLRSPDPQVHVDGRVVRFGLSDVKGVGAAAAERAAAAVRAAESAAGRPAASFSWWDCLRLLGPAVPAAVMERLVQAGAADWTGVSRRRMLAELRTHAALTESELGWVEARGPHADLEAALEALARPRPRRERVRVPRAGREAEAAALAGRSDPEGAAAYLAATRWETRDADLGGPPGGCATERRREVVRSMLSVLRHPPSPLVDTAASLAAMENDVLGIALTCWATDDMDTAAATATCKQVRDGRRGRVVLAVTVEEVRETKTKSGKAPGSPMGRVTLSDGTAELEAVVFPEQWAALRGLFCEGNALLVAGERERKAGYDSLVVQGAWQAGTTDVGTLGGSV